MLCSSKHPDGIYCLALIVFSRFGDYFPCGKSESLIEYLSMIDNGHDVIFQSGAADEFSKKITNFYMEFRERERERYVKYRDSQGY